MTFGLIDTSYIDWPIGLDDAYLRGLQTRAGLAFTDIGAVLDNALGQINGGVDSLIATLLAPPTTAAVGRGGRSGRFQVQRKSEYTLARPQQVERTAHMLAIDNYEVAIGFTEDGLQGMSRDGVQAQADAMREGWDAFHRAITLDRLFSDLEIPVARGTAGTSPGFAGSGTAGNAFSGTYPDGSALPGGYSHYYRDTSANLQAVLVSARNRLKKWQMGPYDLIASANMIDAITALSKFVWAGSALVRPAQGTAEALVDPTVYLGVFDGDVRVHQAVTDFTDDSIALYKSFGLLNPNNPLVWRYDEGQGRDVYVRSREQFPLAEAVAMQRFGPNVNNRTGAALVKIAASGAYAAPVISF